MSLYKRLLVIAVLVVIPSALYFLVAERLSWVPRTFAVSGPINDIAFSPDGKFLAVGRYRYVTQKTSQAEQAESADSRGQLELWAVSSRRPVLWFAKKESNPVDRLKFTSDGKFLFYERNGRLQKMDLLTKGTNQVPNIAVEGYGGFDLSPNGRQIAVTKENQIRFYNSSDGKLNRIIRKTPKNSSDDGSMGFLQYSGSGNILCARVDYDSSFDLLEVSTGRKICNIGSNTGFVEQGRLSPDGKTLATGASQAIQLFDVPTCKPGVSPGVSLGVGPDAVRALGWSSDNQQIAVGNITGKLMLFDARDRRLLKSWQDNKRYSIDNLAFSPDGRILASTSADPDTVTLRRVR